MVVAPAIKGVNEEIFLQYIDNHLSKYVPHGSIMFLDNLSVHKTTRVLERFEHHGIRTVFLPVRAACELSPCDNAFFAIFKKKAR